MKPIDFDRVHPSDMDDDLYSECIAKWDREAREYLRTHPTYHEEPRIATHCNYFGRCWAD